MQKKQDIYHRHDTPPLARKKRGRQAKVIPGESREGKRRKATPRQTSTQPKDRVPFDGYHPDGPPTSLRRRRRKRSPEPENPIGLYLALGMAGLLVIYGASYAAFKILWKKAPPPAPVTAEAEGENAEEADSAPAPVNIYELIENVRRTRGLIEAASRLSDHEDYQGAIKQLNTALETLPPNQNSLTALARNHYLAKEYDPAISLLHQALSGNPDNISARLLLSQALGKSKRHKDAIEVSLWTLQKDPYMSEAHLVAAMSYKALGQTSNAISHLRKAYSTNSEDAFIGNELALAYAEAGNFSRSLDIFKSLMAQDRADSMTYFNLAGCYAERNMPEEAAATLVDAGERFGMSYISSWIQSEKFDAVRDDPHFKELSTLESDMLEAPPAPSS